MIAERCRGRCNICKVDAVRRCEARDSAVEVERISKRERAGSPGTEHNTGCRCGFEVQHPAAIDLGGAGSAYIALDLDAGSVCPQHACVDDRTREHHSAATGGFQNSCMEYAVAAWVS